MAKGDYRIVDPSGHNTVPTLRWQTEANATAIQVGEPVKLKIAGSPYAIPCADGDPVVGTTTVLLGIAASQSTHTATADGVVDVYLPLPGLVYRGKAKTASTADTQAKINALCGDKVVFDLTAGVYTVDAAAGDAATNGIYIVGGNPSGSFIDFTIRSGAVFLSL